MTPAPKAVAAARWLLLLALVSLPPAAARAQIPAEPILQGRVQLGDTVMTSGSVVLHHVSEVAEGEVASAEVAPDGSFVMLFPQVPDEASGEMYFASVRHDGVLYFGNVITKPMDLDSLYLIVAYDTMTAPSGGAPLTLAARTLFFDQQDAQWVVTDLFQLGWDGDRTILPGPEGDVWRYPLPAGARDFAAEPDMGGDVVAFDRGDLVFRGALQPGGRSLVVRYAIDSLSVTVPTPGATEVLDVLVREPAPAMEVEGLSQDQSIQFEADMTYRRFTAENVTLPQIRLSLVEEAPPPPVGWVAVALALLLAGGGLVALRGRTGGAPVGAASGKETRQSLLLEIARLDEEYEGRQSPSPARTKEYRRRRAELMERLRSRS